MIPKLNYTPFQPQPKTYMGTRPILDPVELMAEQQEICARLDELIEELKHVNNPHARAECNREYDFLLGRLESIERRHAEAEAVCCESLAVLKQNEEVEKDAKQWKIASLIGALLVFAKTR